MSINISMSTNLQAYLPMFASSFYLQEDFHPYGSMRDQLPIQPSALKALDLLAFLPFHLLLFVKIFSKNNLKDNIKGVYKF